jgi:transposase
MERMNLIGLVDRYSPAHGNWIGLSRGLVTTTWLAYILSYGDHCLSHVEEWAEAIPHALWSLVGEEVHPLDFSDDRLADILYALSDDDAWKGFEEELGQHLLRVYDLTSNRIRLDATTSSGYWEVTPDGLFQFGHGKDHRPDLPQVKAMMSTLDPLGHQIPARPGKGKRGS